MSLVYLAVFVYFCVTTPVTIIGALNLYVVFRAWRAAEAAYRK